MERIQVYTDGGNRGRQGEISLGAWAFTMTYSKHKLERTGVERDTTNNRQELLGVINALSNIKTTHIPIDIYVDSAYVCNGITKWIFNWKRNNWKTSSKKPVKNEDLWRRLDKLVSKQDDIEWYQVKGHADNEGNNRADELVNQAMDEYLEGDAE